MPCAVKIHNLQGKKTNTPLANLMNASKTSGNKIILQNDVLAVCFCF